MLGESKDLNKVLAMGCEIKCPLLADTSIAMIAGT